MKLFSCDNCHQLLFFESVRCTKCGKALAYLPDREVLATLDDAGIVPSGATTGPAPALPPPAWRAEAAGAGDAEYRVCRNYADEGVCNWAVRADEPDVYCRACRLNRTIPS